MKNEFNLQTRNNELLKRATDFVLKSLRINAQMGMFCSS